MKSSPIAVPLSRHWTAPPARAATQRQCSQSRHHHMVPLTSFHLFFFFSSVSSLHSILFGNSYRFLWILMDSYGFFRGLQEILHTGRYNMQLWMILFLYVLFYNALLQVFFSRFQRFSRISSHFQGLSEISVDSCRLLKVYKSCFRILLNSSVFGHPIRCSSFLEASSEFLKRFKWDS